MGGFEGNHFSIEYPNAHSELKGSASWKLGYFLREIGKNKKIIIHSLTKIQKYVYLDGAIKVHKFFEQCFFSQFEMVNVVHIFNFTSFFTEVTDFSLTARWQSKQNLQLTRGFTNGKRRGER